jgi:hypothetical protein
VVEADGNRADGSIKGGIVKICENGVQIDCNLVDDSEKSDRKNGGSSRNITVVGYRSTIASRILTL